MMTHVITCFWIIVGTMDGDPGSWMVGLEDEPKGRLYMTSFYFTMTTITTVGYGDMSASTFAEQIICCIMMFSGVIAFSFASGALTNFIQQQEELNVVSD